MPTVAERQASLEIIGKTIPLFVSQLPILSKNKRNLIIIKVANELSKGAFELSVQRLVGMIQIDDKESKNYMTTWEQTYAMLRGQFARFYPNRNLVYDRVKEFRIKYNLPI